MFAVAILITALVFLVWLSVVGIRFTLPEPPGEAAEPEAPHALFESFESARRQFQDGLKATAPPPAPDAPAFPGDASLDASGDMPKIQVTSTSTTTRTDEGL